MDIVEKWSPNSTCNEASSGFELNWVEVENNSHDVPTSTTEEIMTLGYPSRENILERYGTVGSYSRRHKVYYWVCECLTAHQRNNKKFSRRIMSKILPFPGYFEDPHIIPEERAAYADYYKSEYSCGHLAAAGNHTYNFNACKSTYCLSNIVPMFDNVNQIMRLFEEEGQKLAKNKGKVYSCTGTMFNKSKPTFLQPGSGVQVPDAFFKVLVYDDDSVYKLKSFRVSNSTSENSKQPMEVWKKRPEDINFETGLNILCDVDKTVVDVLHTEEVDILPRRRRNRYIGS